jgi:hypothetical protein
MKVECTVIERVCNATERYVVECSTGDKLVFEDEGEAMYFASTAESSCNGKWQLKLLIRIWADGEIAADARRLVKGRAAAYVSWYQKQLDDLMQRLGAAYFPGPRGGRWNGKYVWRWYDAMEQRQMLTEVLQHLLCEQRKEVR